MTYKEDGSLSVRFTFTGGTFNIRTVAEKIFDLHPSAIEGPNNVLDKPLPGDFVVRVGADRAEVEKAFQRILETEFEEGIDVKVSDVKRTAYVASGALKLKPDDGTHVAVNCGTAPHEFPEVISSGNVKEFLTSLSQYINTSVAMEGIENSEQRFAWRESRYGNAIASKRVDFQVEKVLELVSRQTGLTFETSEIDKTVLSLKTRTP